MVLKFEFDENLEKKFRETAMKKYGYTKGSLQKASREAFINWILQQTNHTPKVENPFILIDGILSRLKGKKTSVELQHEANKLWMKQYL